MVPQLKLLRLTEIPQIQTYIDLFHGEIYILHAGDEVRFIKGPCTSFPFLMIRSKFSLSKHSHFHKKIVCENSCRRGLTMLRAI